MTAASTVWLIAYDVTEPRRLVKLHRFLLGHAQPLQYSVFLAELTPSGLNVVLKGIAERIDHRRDDVRLYSLPARGLFDHFGRPLAPAGLVIGGAGRRLAADESGRRKEHAAS